MVSNDNDMVEYDLTMVGSHTDMVERFNTRKPKNEAKLKIKKVTRSRREQRQRRHDND